MNTLVSSLTKLFPLCELHLSDSASNPCSTTPTTVTSTTLSPTTSSAPSRVTDKTPGAGEVTSSCFGTAHLNIQAVFQRWKDELTLNTSADSLLL